MTIFEMGNRSNRWVKIVIRGGSYVTYGSAQVSKLWPVLRK